MLDRTIRRRLAEVRLSPFDWVLLHTFPLLYRSAEDVASTIAHSICADNGYFRGVRFGAMTFQQAEKMVVRFMKREYFKAVTSEIANIIAEERLIGQGKVDVDPEHLVGCYIMTGKGFEVFQYIERRRGGCSGIRSRELLSDRCVYRNEFEVPLRFACPEHCESIDDADPKGRLCKDRGCRYEQIGPWARPEQFVMPSGWRLICFGENRDTTS
ncbi:hypothetical protein [Schlesneria paludicola]|uniref:hypothetical protein n=1 Tax=Schlesneria paludicola TaxID=360056 RepID=UPI00029ABAD2|nr:hypothetical protein [Schlesneria paludicola]